MIFLLVFIGYNIQNFKQKIWIALGKDNALVSVLILSRRLINIPSNITVREISKKSLTA